MVASPSVRIAETVAAITGRVSAKPRIGLVLGSGLGAFANTLEGVTKIPYAELPHLPSSNVVGHSGNLCFGRVSDINVVCMQGRVHLYEGHPIESVVHGVRTMAKLGVSAVLLTNAAGGLEPAWAAGDLMLVTDHLNLMGANPLSGPNDPALGPRFPDMTYAYDREIQDHLRGVAGREGIALREGIYAALLGPTYETPAEVRMVRGLGANAVGMSTVPEVIALRHMGVRVGALSCITNLAAGLTGQTLDHAEVEETARRKKEDLMKLLRGWILAIGK
jgi:purine-nucleoside phosphorylase